MSASARPLALAGLAVALVLGAVLRWTPPTRVADLFPRPDALEYEEGARNLVRGEGYCLVVEGSKYAPRYPFGFSVLLAPVFRTYSDDPGTGILVVLAGALLTIAATSALGLGCGGWGCAAGAALLVAGSPLHVSWSRAVMSDVPAAAVTTGVVLWLLSAAGRRPSSVEYGGLGMVIGLAATIRQSNVLLLVPAALCLWMGRTAKPRLARVPALLIGAAIGFVPLLAYNVSRFGSPLGDGYHLWVPLTFFSWRYVVGPPHGGGTIRNPLFYARVLAGLGSLYPWPVALLLLVGTAQALLRPGRPRMLAAVAVALVAVILGFHSVFFWQGERFLLPVLPPCAVLAALPLGAASPRLVRIAAVAGAVLTVAVLLQHRDLYGTFPGIDNFEVRTLRGIDRRVEPNAAIIARTNVFFFDRFLRAHGADRIWLPVGRCEHRGRILSFGIRPYASADAPGGWIRDVVDAPFQPDPLVASVKMLLDEGRPVYFSNLLQSDVSYMPRVEATLSTRFRLEPLLRVGPWELFRVLPREPGEGDP